MSEHTATPDSRGWENGARTKIIFHATITAGDWWQIFNPANEMTLLARETDEARAIVDRLNSHADLVKALEEISRQMTSVELLAEHGDDLTADYETGYDAIINVARAALATLTARKVG